MTYYLFVDFETDEEFIVGAEEFEDALDIAYRVAAQPRYIYRVFEYEAKASGVKIYLEGEM